MDSSSANGWHPLELSRFRTRCLERYRSSLWWTVSIADQHHDSLHRLPASSGVQSLLQLRRHTEFLPCQQWTRYQCYIDGWNTISIVTERRRLEWDLQVRQYSSPLGWKLCVGKWTWNVSRCSMVSIVFSPARSPLNVRFRDGQKYAGEIHVVHQNTETGQLAVLGFFMQSPRVALSRGIDPQLKRRKRDNSSTTNQATMNEWMNYFSIASGVKTNKTGSINMNLAALIGGNLNDFWRYSGSLTVPACTEGVIWSVFTVPIQFNDSFIATFRSNILDLSNRETQPLNGRIVYRNYLNRTGPRASADSCCAAIRETTTPAIGKTSAQSSAIFLLFLSLFISLII